MQNSLSKGISIIIPSYNEEQIIKKTLDGILKNVKISKEVIIVDDSNDNTGKIVREYEKIYPEINFIKNKSSNRGFVKALQVGINLARKEAIVFVMADKCDNPRTINKMYQKIENGWDVVCGSRYMKEGKRIGGPELLGFLSKCLCFLTFYTIRIPTHDVTNTFKMYKRQVLKKLRLNFEAGTAVSMELCLQAYFQNLKITEIPTIWKGRPETRFKLSQRGPKYIRILKWSIENKIRKIIRLKLNNFYR